VVVPACPNLTSCIDLGQVEQLHLQIHQEREQHHSDEIVAAQAYQRSMQELRDGHQRTVTMLQSQIHSLQAEVEQLHGSLGRTADAYAGALSTEQEVCATKVKTKEQGICKLRQQLKVCTVRAISAEAQQRVANQQASLATLKLSRVVDQHQHHVDLRTQFSEANVALKHGAHIKAKLQKQYQSVLQRASAAESKLRRAQIDGQRAVHEASLLEHQVGKLQQGVARGKQDIQELKVKVKSSTLPSEALKVSVYNFIQRELANSKEGVVRLILPGGGRGITVMHVPTISISSTTASKKSLQRRNRVIDQLLDMISFTGGDRSAKDIEAIINQLTSHVRRNKQELYEPALRDSGIFPVCAMTLEQVSKCKNAMSMNLWKHISSFLKLEVGVQIPSEGKLYEHQKLSHMEYETGKIVDSEHRAMSYLRVTSLTDTLDKVASEYARLNQLCWHANIPADEFWFQLLFDKGGTSTKLILKLICIDLADSVDRVTLLAIFEGSKDNHEGLFLCFGPIFAEFDAIVQGRVYRNLPFQPAQLPEEFLKRLPIDHPARQPLKPDQELVGMFRVSAADLSYQLPVVQPQPQCAQRRPCSEPRLSKKKARLMFDALKMQFLSGGMAFHEYEAEKHRIHNAGNWGERACCLPNRDLLGGIYERPALHATQASESRALTAAHQATRKRQAAWLKTVAATEAHNRSVEKKRQRRCESRRRMRMRRGCSTTALSVGSKRVRPAPTDHHCIGPLVLDQMRIQACHARDNLSTFSGSKKVKAPMLQRVVQLEDDAAALDQRLTNNGRCLCHQCVVPIPIEHRWASVDGTGCLIIESEFRCVVMEHRGAGENSEAWAMLSAGSATLCLSPISDEVAMEWRAAVGIGAHLNHIRVWYSQDPEEDDVPLGFYRDGYECKVYPAPAIMMYESLPNCFVSLESLDETNPDYALVLDTLAAAAPSIEVSAVVLQQIDFDGSNRSLSACCAACKREVGPDAVHEIWHDRAVLAHEDQVRATPKRLRGWCNSDMAATDCFCGHSKSAGSTFYCLGCHARLDHRQKRRKVVQPGQGWQVHAPSSLSTYIHYDGRAESIKSPRKRDFQEMTTQSELYAKDTTAFEESVARRQQEADAKAKDEGRKRIKISQTAGKPAMSDPIYANIVRKPFISKGLVLDVVGSMGLHLCLGIRKDAYDMFEVVVMSIDAEILQWLMADDSDCDRLKLARKTDAALTELHDSRRDRNALALVLDVTLPGTLAALESNIADLEEEATDIGLAHVVSRSAAGSYKKVTDDDDDGADELQSKHAALFKEVEEVQKEVTQAESELSKLDLEITRIRTEVSKLDGPLMVDVRRILNSLKLERQAYHSGAFNGNDLDKLYRPEIIEELCTVLAERRVLPASTPQEHASMRFGGNALAQKFRTLFHKLRLLKTLYRETRPLCRHEVAALHVRALSLGHWFPITFPSSNITPKLHWVIYHIPDMAQAIGSTGQTIEQVHVASNSSIVLSSQSYRMRS